MKTKIQIKSMLGEVLFEMESENNTIKKTVVQAAKRGAYLRGAYLEGADLRGADLRGLKLKQLPQDFINQSSRDILFILEHLKAEVPFLREKLITGQVDGSKYIGDCACLLGTLANGDGGLDEVCSR